MRTRMLALAVTGLLVAAGLTACTDDKEDAGTTSAVAADSGVATGGSGEARIGVILPDTTTQRWNADDAKFLKAAFEKQGVPVDIQNAGNDAAAFQRIGDEMISSGVKVLIIVSLDPDSGKAVLDKARARKIPTIDYDRLTLNGGADYYVSFDNVAVGRLQGQGLVQCLKGNGVARPRIVSLNGSPTDNNAAQFKEGYDEVLVEKYDTGEFNEGPGQDVPKWDDKEAGVIFAEMMTATANDIDGVLAANDGLGNAAISVLKKHKRNGKVPVTGQDASVKGLQNILTGDQCMTVYKPIRLEADAAAKLAIGLFKGEKPRLTGVTKDSVSGADIPSVLEKPKPIFKKDVKDVIADGFATTEDVCTPALVKLCKRHGVLPDDSDETENTSP